MSVLVILLPPRARLGARAAAAGAVPVGDDYGYVLSADGVHVTRHGRAPLALLPRADSVVAVLADSDLSWHRLTLPKAPGAKLRAALGGLLEEQLLEDGDALHLALAPQARAGEPTWVAAVHKAWLRTELDKLEQGGLSIERVLPPSWPGDAPQGHFFAPAGAEGDDAHILLCHADEQGLRLLRLQGSLARALLPAADAPPTLWSAEPAVAAAAERWLGSSVQVRTEAERALLATRSLWNLRQFDLAPRHRGTRALRDLLRQWLSPAWRPARIGLVALLLLQVLGLNAWAWQQRQALSAKRLAQEQLLRATFPQLRTVLDAPLQMQREAALLRAAAGQPDESDLEPLLQAAAAAWPSDLAAVESIRFEPGKLTLAASSWDAGRIEQFRAQLQPMGLRLDVADGQLVLSRAARDGGRT